jgi:exopolysaccharide biosynthesis protein
MNVKQSITLLSTLLAVLLASGCRKSGTPSGAAGRPVLQTVAPGVSYHEFAEGDPLAGSSAAHILDIDLAAPGVAVRIAAKNPKLQKGRVYGDALLVREWCAEQGAVGGINGGYFGLTDGARKEVIGLLATDGVIRTAGQIVHSKDHPPKRFVRSVFGLDEQGKPHIGWAVGQRGRGALLTEYVAPLTPAKERFWKVRCAVGCGPRLIMGGQNHITDHEERLVSAPPLKRTFVGYSLENGKPRHLVLGIGLSMTFADTASFLQKYFLRQYKVRCAEAMCLDGGSSTQLVYRGPGGYADTRPTPVTVPTAILVFSETHPSP